MTTAGTERHFGIGLCQPGPGDLVTRCIGTRGRDTDPRTAPQPRVPSSTPPARRRPWRHQPSSPCGAQCDPGSEPAQEEALWVPCVHFPGHGSLERASVLSARGRGLPSWLALQRAGAGQAPRAVAGSEQSGGCPGGQALGPLLPGGRGGGLRPGWSLAQCPPAPWDGQPRAHARVLPPWPPEEPDDGGERQHETLQVDTREQSEWQELEAV